MRIGRAIAAFGAAALIAGMGSLEPTRRYDIYIFEEHGADVYAIDASGVAAAAQVRRCEGRLLAEPQALVNRLRALRDSEDASVVTVHGRGSRVELGRCEIQDDPEEDGKPSLVVIVDASPRQTRRLIREIGGLSDSMRAEMTASLGL
jgi:hypothetical protein